MSSRAREAGPAHLLDGLFRPGAVAVIGASPDPAKTGSTIVRNLLRIGFEGDVYPINPRWPEIDGLRCYTSVLDVPEAPDVAYLLIPAQHVQAAAVECAARGVKFAIVSASGFAEAGTPEGRARQEALATLSEESGMRIVGPNCNGIYNVTDRVSIGFNASHGQVLQPGPVTVLSHSGALFNPIARRATELRVGLARFVSLGNEVDLDLLDFLEYAVADDATGVVALVLDSIGDGERFAALCRELRDAGKPVIALPFGQSDAGAAAAVAHSSRMGTSARLTRAFLDCLGIGQVGTVEALVTAAALALRPRRGSRSGFACFTFSGGAGAIVADAAASAGVPLPELEPATVSALSALSDQAQLANPVDVGALRTPTASFPDALRILGDDPGVSDLVVVAHEINEPGLEWLIRSLVDACAEGRTRLSLLAPGGFSDEAERQLADGGVLVSHDTRTLVEALAAVYATQSEAALSSSEPLSVELPAMPTEVESLALLAAAGIATVSSLPLPTEATAAAAGDTLGWPIVIKGVARGVAHKTEAGLVEVGVRDAGEALAAWTRVQAALHAAGGGHTIAQPQIRGSLEVIVGAIVDPRLGPFLVAGPGGVHAEALDLAVVIPAWVDDDCARSRIEQSALGRMLVGRGRTPGGLDAVLAALAALRRLVDGAPRIREIDINPLVIGVDSAIAVDALVVVEPEAASFSAGDEKEHGSSCA